MTKNDSNILSALRQKIDAVDDQILSLLNQRACLAQEIGHAKAGQGLDYYNPGRELAVFERLIAQNSGPFPSEAIRRVFREIISASLSLEQPIKVAFLGPAATFTHQASQRQFGFSAQLTAQKSIPAVFEEVRRGRADYGVVPVENTTEGIVSHTLDMFIESELMINAEILLEISMIYCPSPGTWKIFVRLCRIPRLWPNAVTGLRKIFRMCPCSMLPVPLWRHARQQRIPARRLLPVRLPRLCTDCVPSSQKFRITPTMLPAFWLSAVT